MRYFHPKTFEEGRETVVGPCNGFGTMERWLVETPIFAEAISSAIPPDASNVLDYGCGVGRLARAILELRPSLKILGVDASDEELTLAGGYVDDARFSCCRPEDIPRDFVADAVVCVYVTQHIPAVDLRDAIRNMADHLRQGGILLHCSSRQRMAVRFDVPGFVDDRCLGVDVGAELAKHFDVVGPMFAEKILGKVPLVQKMVGDHPATIFKKRGRAPGVSVHLSALLGTTE